MSLGEQEYGVDAAASTTTTHYLTFNSNAYGTISVGGVDRDWYFIKVDVGADVGVILSTSTPFGNDPALNCYFNLYGPSGVYLGTSQPIAAGVQGISGPAAFGAYYIEVLGPDAGSYGLRAGNFTATDDSTTMRDVQVGSSYSGTLTYTSDSDLFSVNLQAGQHYALTVSGSVPDFFVAVKDTSGHQTGFDNSGHGAVYYVEWPPSNRTCGLVG